MVLKVLSLYNINPPRSGEVVERIIGTTPLYPGILAKLHFCTLVPCTDNMHTMMRMHLLDHDDVRHWIVAALTRGKYINSQWCRGNSPTGIYACDSYEVSGLLHIPEKNATVMTDVYLKLCLTKSGNTVAVISLHPSY